MIVALTVVSFCWAATPSKTAPTSPPWVVLPEPEGQPCVGAGHGEAARAGVADDVVPGGLQLEHLGRAIGVQAFAASAAPATTGQKARQKRLAQ